MAVYAGMATHDNVLKRYRNSGFDCLCGNVRMAARSLTSIYDEHLKPSGLRATQLAVLWAVVALDSGTVGRIAKVIAMDDSSLTRTLKLLERDKLVSLVAGSDRREKRVKATARGRKAFSTAMPLWELAQAEAFERLGATRSKSGRLQDVNSILLTLSSAHRV